MANLASSGQTLDGTFPVKNFAEDRITHIKTLPPVMIMHKTIKVGCEGVSGKDLIMEKSKTRKNPPTLAAKAMGGRIRTQREHMGFTQAQLGSMIGVTENAIAQYESGRSSPRRERVPALLKALGKSIGWLLTGDEPESEVRAQTQAEREILTRVRELSPEKQEILLKMIPALKE